MALENPKPKSNYITPEQFDKIMEYIPKLNTKYDPLDIEMVWKCAYWLCLRMINANRLKVEDFDLQKNEVYIGKAKRKKGVIAVIPPGFKGELSRYLEEKEKGYFLNCSLENHRYWLRLVGEKLDIQALKSSQDETGEKNVKHIFRKSRAKDLLWGTYDGKRVPLNIIQKILNHDSLETTTKYLNLNPEDIKEYFYSES